MTRLNLAHMSRPIILASASPRRQDLLKRLVDDFEIVPSDADEEITEALPANEVAERNARAKARDVARRLSSGTIIAADTVVAAADGGIVGKPSNRTEAKAILARLSGSRHRVITGVCLLDVRTGEVDCRSACTWVTMRKMSKKEIAEYVASGEADGKAGAYAIQETADRFVKMVEGSISNVVGLPLELLEEMLKETKKGSGLQ